MNICSISLHFLLHCAELRASQRHIQQRHAEGWDCGGGGATQEVEEEEEEEEESVT